MLKKKMKLAIHCAFILAMTFQLGCNKKAPDTGYQRITIDWDLIKADPDCPITACRFYIFSEVQLTEGPKKETINQAVYDVMEGYENGDINNSGKRIYRFMIKRDSENAEEYSVVLESLVKTKIEILNFSGKIVSPQEGGLSENILTFNPGTHVFKLSSPKTEGEK